MTDFWHFVTINDKRGPYTGGSTHSYKAGFHRVEGGALILTKPVDLNGPGWSPDDAPDYLIIPLDQIALATVKLVEREE